MIACPNSHDGTFVVRSTVRQALGTGMIRVNSSGEIVEIIDPGATRVDLRCDECSRTFAILIPGGKRTAPFATEDVSSRTSSDVELNTLEPAATEDEEEDDG